MWSNSTDRVHYYRSYRTAPVKLVPSIISCQASCCLIVFGIFIFIGGCLSRFVGEADQFDDEDFGRIPRTIGTIMMVIGGLLIGGAIIAIIVAFLYYRDYQNTSSETATNNVVYNHAMMNGSTAQLPITGVHYPTQRIESEHPPDYQTATLHTAYYPSAATNDPVLQGNAFAKSY